jgi:hypothetical protein
MMQQVKGKHGVYQGNGCNAAMFSGLVLLGRWHLLYCSCVVNDRLVHFIEHLCNVHYHTILWPIRTACKCISHDITQADPQQHILNCMAPPASASATIHG